MTTPATTQELRRALLAACSAVEKLRDEEPDVYASDYGTLVGDKVVRLLGVAVTATRLGVIRTASEREYRQATQRSFILGKHGNKYVEVEDDTSLLAWVEAFKKPWQCEMRRLKTFAWRGTRVFWQSQQLKKKYQALPRSMALGRGYLCVHSLRKHLLKATADADFLRVLLAESRVEGVLLRLA